MSLFDPTQTATTFGAIPVQGVMDGEFASAGFREPGVELHVGSQGFATFVINANKSGMFKLTLSQESPTNRQLSLAYAANLIAMFQIEDLADGTLVQGPETMIEKHADIKRGNKVIGMEWTFLCAKMAVVAGGDQ